MKKIKQELLGSTSGGGVNRLMAQTWGPRPVLEAPKDHGTAEPKPISAADLAEINAKLEEITGNVKNFAEDVKKKVDAGTEVSAELKEKADKALAGQGELRDRLQDLEQKFARIGKGEDRPKSMMTPGEMFVQDEKVKQFCADRVNRGRVRVDMAAITTATVGAALTEPMRIPGFIAIPDRRMTVRDLLTPGRTSSNSIQYVKETGFTNAAKVVTEGTTKPESTIAFALVTKTVATIAHWMLASKQILDDAPMLSSHIDGRLRFGLMFVEEEELLNGDGTGADLHGIIPQATDYAAPFTPLFPTMIDTLRLAILQSELAEFPATGIVLNPIDWAKIELTKDNEHRYIFAQPQNLAGERLWSRPVVPTKALDEDEFLVGAFKLGAQIFDREDANVEISTEDSDNFRKNLVTIRAEERLVLAVYRPEAFVYGDFGLVT